MERLLSYYFCVACICLCSDVEAQEQKDTLVFRELLEGGDQTLFYAHKADQIKAFIYSGPIDRKLPLLRGDIVEVAWINDRKSKPDSAAAAVPLLHMKRFSKLKDGRVPDFRKAHPLPIKYVMFNDVKLTSEYRDYLYQWVEYYLAYSRQPLVKQLLKTGEQLQITFSIECTERDGRTWTKLGLAQELDQQTSLFQWLFVDPENRMLYEYDLANDQLILFY